MLERMTPEEIKARLTIGENSLTDEVLKELEKLADAASDGPWHVGQTGDARWVRICNGKEMLDIFIETMHVLGALINAPFIAASREAVPALIAEVRRLRAENEELKARRPVGPPPWDEPENEKCDGWKSVKDPNRLPPIIKLS